MGEKMTLITGASSGFGLSIARKLSASRGLILAGRNEAKLEAVRKSLECADKHRLWVHDLRDIKGLGDAFATFLQDSGLSVDHFVHSAGTTGIQLARAMDLQFATQLFNVNVFSAVEIIRSLVQKRVNRGALKSITFISSIATRVGASGYSVYAASKGAVNALSISLAIELAPEVRVNAVLPGIIETPMTKDYFADDRFLALYPLGRGQPEDIADAVEFLSSDNARWITGQEFVVDGGRSVFSPVPREYSARLEATVDKRGSVAI